MKQKNFVLPGALLCCLFASLISAFSQGTAFTYQGRLNDGTNPAEGSYDLRFVLYTADPGGNQIGPILTNSATAVSGGLFTVTLDFGANIFTNTDRFLEIGVRSNGVASFTALGSRQKFTPAPYAIFAANVGSGGLTTGTYGSAVTFSNAANNFSGNFNGNGASVSNVNAATLGGLSSSSFWNTTGNAGTSPNANFLGTTDNQPVIIRANDLQVMQFAYASNSLGYSPNVIGGGSLNFVSNGVVGATIGGGGVGSFSGNTYSNRIAMNYGTIGGGIDNAIDAPSSGSLIGAGAIGGGQGNRVTADWGTVAGGEGNIASGLDATVPGGIGCVAAGNYSFAAGYGASANHAGTFVWSDNTAPVFASTAADQFLIRAGGGVGIGLNNPAAALHVASPSSAPEFQVTQNNTNDSTRLRMNVSGFQSWEMDVSPGSSPQLQFWNNTLRMYIDFNGNVTANTFNPASDRNLKEKFTAVSSRDVLDKVTSMPITEWNFKSEPETRHIGPMAQDFFAAFSVGMDDKHIATVDEEGVALAAIQGLNQKMESENAALHAENTELKARLEKLERLLVSKIGESSLQP